MPADTDSFIALWAFVPGRKTEFVSPSGQSRPFRLFGGASVYILQMSFPDFMERPGVLRPLETLPGNRYRRGLHGNFPAREFAEIQIRRCRANVPVEDAGRSVSKRTCQCVIAQCIDHPRDAFGCVRNI